MNKRSLIKIFKNITNLYYIRNEIMYKLIKLIYKTNNGYNIFNERWNNLIILDACRFDVFQEEIDQSIFKGTLKKIQSKGTHTEEFINENFTKDYYKNIIYITANPYVSKNLKNRVYKLIDVWKDGWDIHEHTVLPKTMLEYTKKAQYRYPNKNLIIHFMQPHYPYIGYNLNEERLSELNSGTVKQRNSFLEMYHGKIYRYLDDKDHFKIYKENFRRIIPTLKELINLLSGKTIITSDHGEAFGEKIHPLIPIRYYGHRKGLRVSSLIYVPWMNIKSPKKKELMDNEMSTISRSINKLKNKKII